MQDLELKLLPQDVRDFLAKNYPRYTYKDLGRALDGKRDGVSVDQWVRDVKKNQPVWVTKASMDRINASPFRSGFWRSGSEFNMKKFLEDREQIIRERSRRQPPAIALEDEQTVPGETRTSYSSGFDPFAWSSDPLYPQPSGNAGASGSGRTTAIAHRQLVDPPPQALRWSSDPSLAPPLTMPDDYEAWFSTDSPPHNSNDPNNRQWR